METVTAPMPEGGAGTAAVVRGMGISLGTLAVDVHTESTTAGLLPGGDPCIPPAALLPRLNGEPVRADFAYPAHPRGSGGEWPPESVLRSFSEGPRFPAAYAWPLLVRGVSSPRRWTVENETHPLGAAQALGAMVGHLTRLLPVSSLVPALVVPNHLKMAEQQALLESVQHAGHRVKLLWRPVAAALWWCQHHQDYLRQLPVPPNGVVARLGVLHLDVDGFEATTVEIVAEECDGVMLYLPARRRPLDAPGPSFGFELLHRLSELVPDARKGINERWRLLWSTPWQRTVLKGLCRMPGRLPYWQYRDGDEQFWDLTSEHWKTIARNIGSCRELNGFELPDGIEAGSAAGIRDWIEKNRQSLASHPALAVVVTGPMATLPPLEGLFPGGSQLASMIWGISDRKRIYVEGTSNVSGGLLARGAAYFSESLASGLPTYKDTLPRLKTSIYLNGVPAWLDLALDSEAFVDGGKVWKRPTRLKGLEVREGRKQLQVTIHHEEYPTVRQVIADFPQPTTRNTALELQVSVEPAQGNARVEVIPSDPMLFGQKKVYLNWREMKDLKKTPDGWLDTLPTLFPELLKRDCSPQAFANAELAMSQYLAHPTPGRLTAAINRLQQRDTGEFIPDDMEHHYENTRTATSSDGKAPRPSPVLDRFVEQLVGRVTANYPRKLRDEVRALAYASTDDPDFQDYLHKRIQAAGINLEQHDLTAVGRCLRNATYIPRFAEVFKERCEEGLTGMRDWIKAFGEILRYRTFATQFIPSWQCEQLVAHVLKIFEREYHAKNLQFNFRYSCLCIAYLLRRRSFDDSFINPQGTFARHIKRLFQNAAHDLESGQLRGMRGTINLPQLLRTVILYIDRQGPSMFTAGMEFTQLVGKEDAD